MRDWLGALSNGVGTGAGAAAIELAERGAVPDRLLRLAIRRLVAGRLAEFERLSAAAQRETQELFLAGLAASPIAPSPEWANRQHYEVPAGFFERVLGHRLKYSCALFEGDVDLDAAEDAMLARTCQRADLADGQRVLDLGCGWGSLALFAAERFPGSRVLAVSNSKNQREFIEARAAARGLGNVQVRTADINHLELRERFDRVVSVEMFEHTRNVPWLLERIAGWLEPTGRLFVHVFAHRRFAYPYETAGSLDWMGRHFFTGGMMPSHELLLGFPEHLRVEEAWRESGTHYQRTAEDWLARLDARRDEVRDLFASCYGPGSAERWYRRWRLFFLGVSELFGFAGGREWGISHYRLAPVRPPRGR